MVGIISAYCLKQRRRLRAGNRLSDATFGNPPEMLCPRWQTFCSRATPVGGPLVSGVSLRRHHGLPGDLFQRAMMKRPPSFHLNWIWGSTIHCHKYGGNYILIVIVLMAAHLLMLPAATIKSTLERVGICSYWWFFFTLELINCIHSIHNNLGINTPIKCTGLYVA